MSTASTRMPVHVGIDVSKARLDLCILPSGQTLQVDNDPAGIGHVIDALFFCSNQAMHLPESIPSHSS